MHCIIHIFIVYSTLKKTVQSFGSNWQRYFSPPIHKTEKTFGYISGNRPEKFNIPFFVQNHIVFATKLHFNSFIDYNRFQQMFYMIITANICISKWCLSKFIAPGTKGVTYRGEEWYNFITIVVLSFKNTWLWKTG